MVPYPRQGWVVWENGRYPDVIVELMSPTTAEIDTGAKKELYEQVLEREITCFNPDLILCKVGVWTLLIAISHWCRMSKVGSGVKP